MISGKVINKNTGQPAANVPVFLSFPGKQFQALNAVSDNNGRVQFNPQSFTGISDVVIKTADNDSLYRVEIDNPFSNKPAAKNIAAFTLPVNVKNDLTNRHIAMQVENTYNLQAKKKYTSLIESIDTTAFYGLPSFSFYLDAYTRFNTMEEVLREFVTDVRVRKKGDNFTIRVLDRPTVTFYNDNPLVLIDGVPVLNMNKVMEIMPTAVKKVDVLSRRFYAGASVYDGIISYRTYNGDLGGYTLDPNSVVLKFDGLQQQREFYQPTYETNAKKDSRRPDLRNVLYWNPSVKTTANGEFNTSFYTSDFAGKYAVVIQGITKDGKSGSNLLMIEVKQPALLTNRQ